MKRVGLLVVLAWMSSSCGVDGVIFLTKTGVAVDVDASPPSVDIGYLRHEGVVARVYDDDGVATGDDRPLVHPVLTTVGTTAGSYEIEMNQSFATGAAALVIADALADPNDYRLGCADNVPKPTLDGSLLVRKGGGTPYFFGTDTTVGLGVTWAGTNIPQSVTIGYRRKELAVVPLDNQEVWHFAAWGQTFSAEQIAQLRASESCLDPSKPGTYASQEGNGAMSIAKLEKLGYLIAYEQSKIPSLIATAVAQAEVGASAKKTGIKVGQTFATGAAATLMAKHGAVRRVIGPSLVPNFEGIVALQGLTGDADLVLLNDNVKMLDALAGNDAEVTALRNGLAELSREFAKEFGAFQPYGNFKVANGNEPAALTERPTRQSPADFREVLEYVMELRGSVESLAQAGPSLVVAKSATATAGGLPFKLTKADRTTALLADAAAADAIQSELPRQRDLLAKATTRVARDARLIRAVRYVSDQMLRGGR